MESAQEDDVKKAYKFLRGFASGKVAAGGALAFVIAYTSGGYINCPLCGGQGLHPWEWGVTLGI